MAIKTRLIQSHPLSDHSGDLKADEEFTFSVLSDSGPGKLKSITGTRLYISLVRSYSAYYTMEVRFGGVLVGTTVNPGVFDSARSALMQLISPSPFLVTGTGGEITISIRSSSPTGSKLNFRQNCYVTLEVDYEEAEEPKRVFFYDGSRWLPCEVRYYDGSKWLPCEAVYSPDGQTFQ